VKDEAASERMQAEERACKTRSQRHREDQKEEVKSYMKFLQKVFVAADSMVSFSTQGYDNWPDNFMVRRRRTRKYLSDPSFQYAALVAHEYCFEHIRRDKTRTDHGRDVMMLAPPSMPWHLLAKFQRDKLPKWCEEMGDAEAFTEDVVAQKTASGEIPTNFGLTERELNKLSSDGKTNVQICNAACSLTIPAHLLKDIPQPKVDLEPTPQEVLDQVQHDHDQGEVDKAEEILRAKEQAEQDKIRLAEEKAQREKREKEERITGSAYVPMPIELEGLPE